MRTSILQDQPSDVNLSQWQAITHQGGHLLVVAGPGTGKTHTLTHRIAKTLGRLQHNQKILAITFTNKAAEEMKARLTTRLGCSLQRVFVGTFHGFCLQILREFIDQTILPKDFRVISPEEMGRLSKGLWPKESTRQRKDKLEAISQWKATDFASSGIPLVSMYNQSLRKEGYLDYDDLLLETLKLLQMNKSACQQIQEIYPYIFVDEYQDINGVQHALLKELVGLDVELTAIGDPNQAIYGFRGSNVAFFESFPKDFSNAAVLSLSDNYRSAQNLLSASTQIMAKGNQGLPVPELIARIYEQGHLILHAATTDKAEAEYVVHKIEQMVGGTSMFSRDSGRAATSQEGVVTFSDIAVLYRLNSQRFALKEALDRSGIPYHVVGSSSDEIPDEICLPRDQEITLEAEKVTLLTIHAAKGLEFPVVFIVGCEENLLPLNLEGLTSDPQEERRLFYVAMTRAKHYLYLLRAKRRRLYGKTFTNLPSRFLTDIEEGLKQIEHTSPHRREKKKQEEQMSLF